MANPVKRAWHWVSEQTTATISAGWVSFTGIRSTFRPFGASFSFWPRHPRAEGTIVNYEATRKLYRNADDNGLGGGFAKPIVDLQVAFMGTPTCSTGDDALDSFLNECIRIYWTDEIQQMMRDGIRDSRTILRLQRPDVNDPLMTLDEAEHCAIEVICPELVTIERDMANKRIIRRAVIAHRLNVVVAEGDPTIGLDPVTEQHDVLEIIDQTSYRFFNQNQNEWMPELESGNSWGFVPLLEVHNEWESYLQGGQSDLEPVIPFIEAFHEVLAQGLQAHRYHSTPKVKFKIKDFLPFAQNNYPELIDQETGQMKTRAEVPYDGREILFLQPDEDADFLEATSVLGDTKTLAEFILDCICVSSQTPEWAFMRVDSGSANSDRNAQTVPFIKKIERKRRVYQKPVQDMLKMVMVATDRIPVRPKISWEIVRPDDQVVVMQAFQQLVMGLEVARARGEISDETYQRMLQPFLPVMKSPALEKSQPDVPAPTLQPQITSQSGKNG
jgi:hypothetical protein